MLNVSMRRRHGFSLIELVVVVVIIGIIATIAVTKLSHTVEGSNEAALSRDLQVLRRAIEAYNAEHDAYPAVRDVADQLTKYTDLSGDTSPTRTGAYTFGPYLRQVPSVPVGPARGRRGIAAAAGADVGWIYNETTGEIVASSTGG